jgi:hypothetical protein
MAAMVVQVMSLMWMRTTINYQYRHGGTMTHTMRTLYAQGGIFRFYQGVMPALIQVRSPSPASNMRHNSSTTTPGVLFVHHRVGTWYDNGRKP